MLYNSVGDTPANKIQLSNSCGNSLKFNALGPAKGIEELF
jgi:hypothetical protein